MKDIVVKKVLIPSLVKRYKVDYDNTRNGVPERYLCARLAHHMENMREYDETRGDMCFGGFYADGE